MPDLIHIPDKAQIKTILGTGDGKADASILIGGSMTDRFAPIIYSSKWNKESWVSINRKGVVTPKGELGTFRDGRMELVIGNSKDTYYIIPDGHLEYEISFNDSLPNYIDLDLNFPDGMEFFKQLVLTEEEIFGGFERPENVINSYAVYWPKRNNQYKTGKHGHIYRCFLKDANESWVWCDQKIDGNIWRIIPGNEEWLKSAVYPITIGPNLGYDTPGGSAAGVSTQVYYVGDTTDATGGNVQNFHAAVDSIVGGTGDELKLGLFTDDSASPDLLLEQVRFTVGVSDDENTPSVDQDLLAGSTNYWVGVIVEEGSAPKVRFDSAPGGGVTAIRKTETTFEAEFTSPAGSNAATTATFSIWVDYVAAGGETIDASAVDGITMSDITGALGVYQVLSTDGFKMSDSNIALSTLSIIISDGFKMSDGNTVLATLLGNVSDGIKMSDILSVNSILQATGTDGFKMSDAALIITALFATATDGFKMSDSNSVLSTLLGNASDGFKMSDSNIALSILLALATDGITMSDIAGLGAAIFAAVSDGFKMSDSNIALSTLLALATDGFEMSDLASTLVIMQGVSSDGFKIGDTALGIINKFVTAVDGITMSDSGSVVMTLQATALDGIQLSDLATALATLLATASDGFKMADISIATVDIAGLPNVVSITITGRTSSITFTVKSPSIVLTNKIPGITWDVLE